MPKRLKKYQMKLFNPRRPKIRLFNEFKIKTAKKKFPIGPYKHETTSP